MYYAVTTQLINLIKCCKIGSSYRLNVALEGECFFNCSYATMFVTIVDNICSDFSTRNNM